MRFDRLKKIIMLPGQILGLTLIGMLLLSSLLYYKAVKAQRYLEPSLALAQPRIEFAQKIRQLLEKEFGSEKIKGVVLASNSIYVDNSLIFADPVSEEIANTMFIKKMSNIFLSILQDPQMKPHLELILVSTRFRVSPHLEMTKKKRSVSQHIAGLIMDSLFDVEPELLKYYGLFSATALPVQRDKKDNLVEFLIIPSEHLHIEMIKSLEKYFL